MAPHPPALSQILASHYTVTGQLWAGASLQGCVRFSLPLTPRYGPWFCQPSGVVTHGNTDTYPWGQAHPDRQGPRAGTLRLRFSSCCSHVLSLLSSGSVCRSLQFTKTWPAGQAAAGRGEGGAGKSLDTQQGAWNTWAWGGFLGSRAGQGDLRTSIWRMQAEMGL